MAFHRSPRPLAAMVDDVQAIGEAGGGASLMFLASPGRALKMRILGGAGLADSPVVGSPVIEADTLIAIDPSGFASGFGSEPQIDIATEATLHMADPAEPIRDDNTGNSLASGAVRSLYQS